MPLAVTLVQGFKTLFGEIIIDIESQNRLLKVCYVPATNDSLPRQILFLLWSLTVLMKQTRQAVCAIKQFLLLRSLWMKL